jgi:hypothetical protein
LRRRAGGPRDCDRHPPEPVRAGVHGHR